MTKLGFSLLLLLVFNISALPQQKVALQHNGATTIFSSGNPFADAYTAAVSGDTIYLPGGNIPIQTVLNKSLKIYGAGHNPDSSSATSATVLSGSFSVQENAVGLRLEGIEITGDITFSGVLTNVAITRCKLRHLTLSGTNHTVSESVITGNIGFGTSSSNLISNNVIQGVISGGTLNGIRNNILLFIGNSYAFYNVENTSIINNIIFQNYLSAGRIQSGCKLSAFGYNVFSATPIADNNTFEANYFNVDLSTVFVNQTGTLFDYSQNYHLVNPSTYHDVNNAQIGIYGGPYPWKQGSVPTNPHIVSKVISSETNAAGHLNVTIRVEAQ